MKYQDLIFQKYTVFFSLFLSPHLSLPKVGNASYFDGSKVGFKVKEEPNNDLTVFGFHDIGEMFRLRTDAGGGFIDTVLFNGSFDWDLQNEKFNFTSDGGLIAVLSIGQVAPGGSDDEDFGLVKRNANGNLEWVILHGDTLFNERALGVIQTSDGGYLVTGSFRLDSLGALPNIYAMKADSAGNLQWKQNYGDPTIWQYGYSVAETPAGDFCHFR